MRRAYDSGKVEVIRESLCDYDDQIARWSRYTARLFVNPANNHLEAVFYGEDISRDKDASQTQMSIIQSLAQNDLDVLLLDVRACLDAGMNAHIAKPIDLGVLIRLIARFAKESI